MGRGYHQAAIVRGEARRRGARDAESTADVFDVLAPPDGPRVAVLLHVPHSLQTSAGAYEPRGDVADQHHHRSSTHLTTSLRTKNSPARTGSPVSLLHCRAYAVTCGAYASTSASSRPSVSSVL